MSCPRRRKAGKAISPWFECSPEILYSPTACDQLLGYLTWRDGKASIVIFNQKNKDFSKIRGEVPETFKAHSGFIRELSADQQHGEWRFVLSSTEDPGREITVHVFLFDLYVGSRI